MPTSRLPHNITSNTIAPLIGSCWPSPEQTLLLQAALFSGEAARQAWEKWNAGIHIDTIDPGSFRLLPLLYENISSLGITPSYLDRIKGCYRMSWTNNMLLLHKMHTLLEAFAASSIPVYLTKGLPLILEYYEHPGLRPMEDIDIFVPEKSRTFAWDVLSSLGYLPKATTLPRDEIFQHRHAWSFYGEAGQDVDLHWHVLTVGIDTMDLEREIMDQAVTLLVNGIEAKTLCPTDLLFQICIHGSWWCAVPPLRWAADAVMILRKRHQDVDWDRLVDLAAISRLSLPLLDTLTFLHNELEQSIPVACLQSLADIPTTTLQRQVYRTLTSAPPLTRPWPLLFYTLAIHIKEQSFTPFAVLRFPNYLKHNWEMKSLWQVPFIAAFRGAKSFSRKFRKDIP